MSEVGDWHRFNNRRQANRVMNQIDGWVRMRLRSILRKRSKRKGRRRGNDHRRWPNVFFAKAGLFTLKQAHQLASRSMKMAH